MNILQGMRDQNQLTTQIKKETNKNNNNIYLMYNLKVTTIAYESNNNSLWIPYLYTKFHVLPKDVKVRFKPHRNIVWASKIPNYTRRHANPHVSNEGKDPSNKNERKQKKKENMFWGQRTMITTTMHSIHRQLRYSGFQPDFYQPVG